MSDKIYQFSTGSFVPFTLIFSGFISFGKLNDATLSWFKNKFIFVRRKSAFGKVAHREGIYEALHKPNITSMDAFFPITYSRLLRDIAHLEFRNAEMEKLKDFSKHITSMRMPMTNMIKMAKDVEFNFKEVPKQSATKQSVSTLTAEECLTSQKGGVILAVFENGKMSFSTTPKVHYSETWRAEAERLAAVTGLKVIALRIEGTVTSGKVVWD